MYTCDFIHMYMLIDKQSHVYICVCVSQVYICVSTTGGRKYTYVYVYRR